jgi:sulfonate transport system substrate-binding protein
MNKMKAWRLVRFAVVVALALTGARAARADAPTVIRVFNPGTGIGNRPSVGGSSVATANLKGMLEDEFRKDGIRIQWTFLPGAGPAVNESYANGLVDFSLLGDLPSIIGHSGGLRTRVLAATAIRQNTYVAVPADSSASSVKDLRGKTIAIFKGTNLQLAASKILEASGLSDRDLHEINMDSATAMSAIITKSVDASFGGNELLALRDQGTAKIIYTTKGDDPRLLRHCTLIGSEDFIQKYPELTERVVKVVVLAAKWMADQEANPAPVYALWSKSGVPFSSFKEEVGGASLKVLASPLIDDYLVSEYQAHIDQAKRYGLIRRTFDFQPWVDKSFLDRALKELNLEHFWTEYDGAGRPKG